MATAVETGSEPRTPSPPASLPVASFLGTLYVLAALAVLFYFLPRVWAENVTPRIGDKLVDWVLWIPVLGAALGGLVWFGDKLAVNAPRGVRGGVFLMVAAAVLIFLLWRWAALSIDGTPGLVISGLLAAFLLYLAIRFFTGRTGARWMVGLEEQGWFSTASYKKSLGVRVRRLTILGILLIGGSGIYSLTFQGLLPNNWTLAMPFDWPALTILPGAQSAVPAILAGLTLWFAWRAVNVPTFAEFLIATEAEMNKVSWTPRKRLAQDTVVVLTTTLLLTLFLLVVDVFWGWLLSRSAVGVLPPAATGKDQNRPGERAKW
jgi:preprotein translocase SecE subunit